MHFHDAASPAVPSNTCPAACDTRRIWHLAGLPVCGGGSRAAPRVRRWAWRGGARLFAYWRRAAFTAGWTAGPVEAVTPGPDRGGGWESRPLPGLATTICSGPRGSGSTQR